MPATFESQRLYYRELVPSDVGKLFELDSNPDVHRFLGNKPVKAIAESRAMIASIQEQYATNGVGRMAAILKDTGEFIGWGGLKLVTERTNGHDLYYDVGYRLLPQFWGKGFATESAKAAIDYGFNVLKLEKINATAAIDHVASRKALEKAGLQFVETFRFPPHQYDGVESAWYVIINPNNR